jgi:hypothetical protein
MRHEQKIIWTKVIVIAKLHDCARHDDKFPLVKCVVFAKAARAMQCDQKLQWQNAAPIQSRMASPE